MCASLFNTKQALDCFIKCREIDPNLDQVCKEFNTLEEYEENLKKMVKYNPKHNETFFLIG